MNPIVVSRGEVVGIGKVKIPRTDKFNHEIQMLSFVDIKEADDSFISTCIHLRLDGYGNTAEEAELNMAENAYFFLRQNFQKLSLEDAWDNLRDLFKSDDWSDELWDAYHEAQIQLSMQGVPTDNTAGLIYRLDQLARRIREWESLVIDSGLEKDRMEIMGNIKELAKDLIVESTPLKKAA